MSHGTIIPMNDIHPSNSLSDTRQKSQDHKIQAFVCVEVLRPSQPNGVMSSTVSLPNHMFTGQA